MLIFMRIWIFWIKNTSLALSSTSGLLRAVGRTSFEYWRVVRKGPGFSPTAEKVPKSSPPNDSWDSP